MTQQNYPSLLTISLKCDKFIMKHNPLCKLANTDVPVGYVGVMINCDCYRVRYVRDQIIRECIAAVEAEFALSQEPPCVEEVTSSLRALLNGS
jgi:hypothetical protein